MTAPKESPAELVDEDGNDGWIHAEILGDDDLLDEDGD